MHHDTPCDPNLVSSAFYTIPIFPFYLLVTHSPTYINFTYYTCSLCLFITCVCILHSVAQVSTFNELVDISGESADDDSYKALTALGILTALQSLVKATFNETQVLEYLAPHFHACRKRKIPVLHTLTPLNHTHFWNVCVHICDCACICS